ncbi:DUF1861 family protein [Paenibacillus taihuensis]|nr:DUF1861 family protein [Paenibacillus taihuensis]
MKITKGEVRACSQLLDSYRSQNRLAESPVKLKFAGIGDCDVYNITAPFEDEGELVIAGRVEPRDSEHSHVLFFMEQGGVWSPSPDLPRLELQDPFYTRIGNEIVVGGVQIFPHPVHEGGLAWRTVMYKGDRLRELKPFFTGPDGMKDLRIAELRGGDIAVLTRPQGEKGGRGKIGFTRVSSLEMLMVERVEEAPLLEGQFIDEEWGGANELHPLAGGLLGVLGHISCFDAAGDVHYYPMAFVIDPYTGRFTDIELIAVRSRFLPGEAKLERLVDVVFSGGLVRREDGTAELYAGISDVEAQCLTIKDPFLHYEMIEAEW